MSRRGLSNTAHREWCEHCLEYDLYVEGPIDIRNLTVDTPHNRLENMPRHYREQRNPFCVLLCKNPFYVAMTVGFKD